MIDRPTRTLRDIRALALCAQPGAIVLAEQAVDDHLASFDCPGDRLTALRALSSELFRIGNTEPERAPFLAQVQSYIGLLQTPAAA